MNPARLIFWLCTLIGRKLHDLLDVNYGGDTWHVGELIASANDRQMQALRSTFVFGKSKEEILREQSKIWEMEGEDMDYLWTFIRVQRSLREIMGSDRVDKFFAGPNAAIKKAYSDGLDQSYELWRSGQITYDGMEERQIRLEEEREAALNSEASPAVPEDLE